MKRFFKNLSNRTGFIQGIIFTMGITSLISYAATNLPGFHVFNAGDPISSSEMNENFEKVAGLITLQAENSGAISYTVADGPGSTNCNTYDGFTGKLNLTASISDADWQQGTDNTGANVTNGQSYSFYEITQTGWYETRLVVNNADFTYTCTTGFCSEGMSTKITAAYAPMVGSEPHDSNYVGVTSVERSWYGYDSDGDSIIQAIEETYTDNLPEIKRVFLKAGNAVYLRFEMCTQYAGTGTDGLSFSNAGDISLTLIKL